MKASDLQVTRFRGLNTVGDPMTLGLSWQTQADNVHFNSEGKPQRRDGFGEEPVIAGTDITASYGTRDQQRAYMIDDGVLKTGDGVELSTGLSSARTHWAEANDMVFLANGTDALIIRPDEVVLPWAWPVPDAPAVAAVTGMLAPGLYRVCCTYILPDGRETGPSEVMEIELTDGQALQVSGISHQTGGRTRTYISAANSEVFNLANQSTVTAAFVWDFPPTALGVELRTMKCDPIPAGSDVVQFWRGRMWAVYYDQASDTTAIFPSKAFGFHLFDLDEGETVDGRVLFLAPTDSAMVIGTNKHIWARNTDGMLVKLAHYGAVPGRAWAFDLTEDGSDTDKTVLFWTTRGLCRALPFRNLTAGHLSVAPGVQVNAVVRAADGERHFLASLHAGGTAFNSRSTS